MDNPTQGVPPYHVAYSALCRETTKQLLVRAAALGRFAELAQVVGNLHLRLKWIPLDFGEPLRDLPDLGLRLCIGALAPLVVRYGVDEARRIVYVNRPFQLLSNTGL